MMFPRQHMAWGNWREYSRCKGITSQLPQQYDPACKCRMFRGTKSSWWASRRLEFQSGIIVLMFRKFVSLPYSTVEKGACLPQRTELGSGMGWLSGSILLPCQDELDAFESLFYHTCLLGTWVFLSPQSIRKLFTWQDHFPWNDTHFFKKKMFITKKNICIIETPELTVV